MSSSSRRLAGACSYVGFAAYPWIRQRVPNMQTLSKHLLVWCVLLSRCPKEVTPMNPESAWGAGKEGPHEVLETTKQLGVNPAKLTCTSHFILL